MSATATLRDNLLTIIGGVLLKCLDDDTRVSFERLQDALQSRHLAAYDIHPILPIIQGKSLKQQLYLTLQIIERIGSSFVSGYATLAKEAVYDDRIDLNSLVPTDLISSINNEILKEISLDQSRKFQLPMTLDDAFDEVMEGIRSNDMTISYNIISVFLSNIPNFDMTNPEVPETIRFVTNYMMKKSKINDTTLDFISLDQLQGPDILVKTVLQRLEVSELSSGILRECIGILLEAFDSQQWNRKNTVKFSGSRIKSTLQEPIVPDYYPKNIYEIFKYHANNPYFENLTNVDSVFYDGDTAKLLEFLTSLQKRDNVPEEVRKTVAVLQSFVSQNYKRENIFSSNRRLIGSHVASKHLNSFYCSCIPEELRKAAENLHSLLTENLPWIPAFDDEISDRNPWQLMADVFVNLKNTPIPKNLGVAIDNFIYQIRTSGIVEDPSDLFKKGIIFQRPNSSDVEVDMYSLLSYVPNVFDDEKFLPIIVFATKIDFLDYLGHEFNKFEYNEPRQFLLALLERSLSVSAVRATKPLRRALEMAKELLEKPLLNNLYNSEELRKLMETFPEIHEDPRYIPVKLLFSKRNLFSHISPDFSLAGIKSSSQRIKFILSAVALNSNDSTLTESINFALNNVECTSLPVRFFTHQDFVYLVNQLLSENDTIREIILNSSAYNNVSDWQPALTGSPEMILTRILNHPTFELLNDTTLAKTVRDVVVFLEGETVEAKVIMRQKTLMAMLDYLPDQANFRVIRLLLQHSNLVMLVPNLKLINLDNQQPRKNLKYLLEHLAASPHIKSRKLLSRSIDLALNIVEGYEEMIDDSQNFVSYLNMVLINPFDPQYAPLKRKLEELNYNDVPLHERLQTLKNYLRKFREISKDLNGRRAAKIALEQLSPVDRRLSKEILTRILRLLPKNNEFDSLRKLLTIDWVRGILPKKFRVSEFKSQGKLLRAILTVTKNNRYVRTSHLLLKIISLAEQELGGLQPDVATLREIVVATKAAIYEPMMEFLTGKNLNQINVTFVNNPQQSVKQKLLDVLHQVIHHPVMQNTTKTLQLLQSVRQDVITFGVDVDLLTVLDDVGIVYDNKFTRLRLFLHRDDVAREYGPTVFESNEAKQRFHTLIHLLSKSNEIKRDHDLRDAVTALKYANISVVKPVEATVSDFYDILSTIPPQIRTKYSDVLEFFTTDVLDQVTNDNEILTSREPLITLLTKISELPDILRNNYTVASKLVTMYEELRQLVKMSYVADFQIKPLVRELYHVQKLSVDFLTELFTDEVPFVNATDPNDNIAVLNVVMENILIEIPTHSDQRLKNNIMNFIRDLELMAGPHLLTRDELSSSAIRNIISLLPSGEPYAPIMRIIQSRELYKYLPQKVNWQTYRSANEKLDVILTMIAKMNPDSDQIERSLRQVRRYVVTWYNDVTKEQVKRAKNNLYKVSTNSDLVPLELFLTRDNLIKYLHGNFHYSKYRSPNEALIEMLGIFHQIPSLKKQKRLDKVIITAQQMLHENGSISNSELTEKSTTRGKLPVYDLKYILALKIEESATKKILNPGKLIRFLPNDFEPLEETTFKVKSMHLMKQILKRMAKTRLHKKLEKIIRYIQLLPDVPDISEDVVNLLNNIPRDSSLEVNALKKLLKPSTLTQLFPGDFNMRNFNDSKTALHEVLKILKLTINGINTNSEKIISKLYDELNTGKSEILQEGPQIKLTELKSLMAEIPFNKHETLQELNTNITADKILSLLPLNFNVHQFTTRKSRLMEVLNTILSNRECGELREPVNRMLNIIAIMPDAPKIHDSDIEKSFSKIPLSRQDAATLANYCSVKSLTAQLPTDFDISRYESTKKKISVIVRYCKKINPSDENIKKVLSYVTDLSKKLPRVDLTNLKINQMLETVNCGNLTLVKPLKMLLSQTDVVSLIPPILNLETKVTFKLKISAVLKALRKIREFGTEEHSAALKNLEDALRKMPNLPVISENDLMALKRVPVMQDKKAELCTEYLTLTHIIKAVPSSFNINQFPDDQSKLSALISHLGNMQLYRGNESFYESCKFVTKTLSIKLKDTIRNRLENLVNDTEELLPLKIFLLSHKKSMFDTISVPQGYKNENFDDSFRLAVTFFMKTANVSPSKTLEDSLKFLLRTLPKSNVTEFDITEAIEEIPKSDEYTNLSTLLRCPDVLENLKKSVSLPSDYSPKRLLVDLLDNLSSSWFLDTETVHSLQSLRNVVKRDLWNEEVEELFKQFTHRNFDITRLDSIRSFFIEKNPNTIFGANYHEKYPTKVARLKALYKKLMDLPDAVKTEEIRQSLSYFKQIQENQTSNSRNLRRSVADINIRSLLVTLPKPRDEKIISGLLKFFLNPQVLEDIPWKKNPFDYKYKGALMKAIIRKGRNLKSVKRDPQQHEALKYYQDKIIMDRHGAEPIELNNYAENSNLGVDFFGLLKALDVRTLNVTAAVVVVTFFYTQYDPLLHGFGFDQAAYITRGSYLMAFLHHLIDEKAVPSDVKINANLLLSAVKLEGPGMEHVDLNERNVPASRIFSNRTVHTGGCNLPVTSMPMVTKLNNQLILGAFESSKVMLQVSLKKLLQPVLKNPQQNQNGIEESKSNNLKITESEDAKITRFSVHAEDKSVKKMDKNTRKRSHAIKKIVDLKKVSNNWNVKNGKLSISEQETFVPLSKEKNLHSTKKFTSRHKRRLLWNDDIESATFQPDDILFQLTDRRLQNPKGRILPHETKYIENVDESEEFLIRNKHPVTALKVHPDEFPGPVSHSKSIPHELSRNPESINLETRKLFIRKDTKPEDDERRLFRKLSDHSLATSGITNRQDGLE